MIKNINDIVYDAEHGIGIIKNIERKDWYNELSVQFKLRGVFNSYRYSSSGYSIDNEGVFSDIPTLFALEKIDDKNLNGEWNEHPMSVTKNLYPGQLVLCRRYSIYEWIVSIFSNYDEFFGEISEKVDKNISPYRVCNGEWMKFCIPLKGFE